MPLKATYAAMVTRLDRNIGRLLETIKQLDSITRETLIVFASDHSGMFESGNAGTSCRSTATGPFAGRERNVVGGGRRVPGFGLVAGTNSGGS